MVLVNRLTNKKTMNTTEVKERILVWSKTERAGDIVTVDKVDGDFTLFTDGSRCYTNIIGEEFFIEARSIEAAEQLASPFKGPSNIIPVPTKVERRITDEKSAPSEEVNIMLEMLKKMSAKNTITMPLDLNIPSKEVYNLFKDQMDITKADLNEQISLLIQSQIDNLQQQLKPQAEEFIKNYYNGRNEKTNNRTIPNTRTEPASTGSSKGGANPTAPSIEY
jgi:hypothetical protein